MLTLVHATIGTLVIVTNAIAALWLALLVRWGRTLTGVALWSLWSARGTLALQILLGIALIGGGASGRSGHYVFALSALGATWYASTRTRRPQASPYAVALGCTATALCALGAYLLGWG